MWWPVPDDIRLRVRTRTRSLADLVLCADLHECPSVDGPPTPAAYLAWSGQFRLFTAARVLPNSYHSRGHPTDTRVPTTPGNPQTKGLRPMFEVERSWTAEVDDYTTYEQACDALHEHCANLRAAGWQIEQGWASRDNLLAAVARRDGRERTIQIVRA